MSLFGNKSPGLSINTSISATPSATSSFLTPPNLGGSTSFFPKPANPGASAGTLFGAGIGNSVGSSAATSAPSQAGTLFGGAAASKPGRSLFSGTTTAAPSGGSLFGNATTSAPSGGSLFGSTMNATAPSGRSLFGNGTTTQPASGSLFNTSTNAGQTNSNPSGGGSSLFGNITTNQQTSTGSSLFGPSSQQPQQQQQQPGSLFGGASSTSQSNLLRPSLNQPSQFGPQQTQRSIFTSSIGQYTASQTTVPGVRIDASQLRPTTRFTDLHEALQTELERLDTRIHDQMDRAAECVQAMPAVAHALTYVPSDAEYCARKLDAMQSALEADAGEIDELKTKTRKCAHDAKIGFRNVSALRTPAQYAMSGSAVVGPVPAGLLDGEEEGQGRDLAKYMGRQVEEMEAKLERFKRGLGEVESYLRGVEANVAAKVTSTQMRSTEGGARRSADDQVRELAGVLREFEGGILGVASKVGGLREQTQEVMLEESRSRGRLGVLF